MRAITMTTEQTEAYDRDDTSVIRGLRAEAQRLADESRETVEVYTDDGIVAEAVTHAAVTQPLAPCEESNMTITYVVQQHTGYQYEPIPEGTFDSADQAIAGMRTLEKDLGWRDMRVIENIEDETSVRDGDIVIYGVESDVPGDDA